jgi:hypothetical protein
VTAPATDAPATDSGEGVDSSGQAPENSTSPAGPGETASGPEDESDGPLGRRHASEHVRSASRDDDAGEPEPDGAGSDAGDDPAGDKKARAAAGNWKVEDLPPGAQKLIADLRKEAGTRRTEAAEAKKAREDAEKRVAAGDERFASATEAFMRALGLTPEPDEPERSPEELIGELTSKYQQSRIELAVYRAAADHGADPDALLDSRGFLTKAHALDPAAEDFEDAIATAIGEAVDGNPKLRAAAPEPPAPAVPSGGDFGGGPAGRIGPDQWSVDDFRRARNTRG